MDAASEEECAFRCTDCLLPSLRDAINDAIDEEGGIGQINEFAQLLAQKNQIWDANDLVKYKALLSVAGHPSLQDAMQLMHGLDAYELRPEVAQTWEYAEAGSAGGSIPNPAGRPGRSGTAGERPRSHHGLRPAPQERRQPATSVPARTAGKRNNRTCVCRDVDRVFA